MKTLILTSLLLIGSISAASTEYLEVRAQVEPQLVQAKTPLQASILRIRLNRGFGEWPIGLREIPVQTIYLAKSGISFGTRMKMLDVSACKSASSGDQCATIESNLDISAEPWICGIKLIVGDSERILPWGNCATLPTSMHYPDLSLIGVSDDGSSLNLEVGNTGEVSERPVRLYAAFYDKFGNELTYRLISMNEVVQTGDRFSVALNLGPIIEFTCKVRVTIDPDGDSFETNKMNNQIEFDYGGCRDEEIESRNDPGIQSVNLNTDPNNPENTSIQAILLNSGDKSIVRDALNLVIKGYSADGAEIFSQVSKNRETLAPEEVDLIEMSIPSVILEQSCKVIAEIFPGINSNDSNPSNNVFSINRCN